MPEGFNLFNAGFKIIPVENPAMKEGEGVLLLHPNDYKIMMEKYNIQAANRIIAKNNQEESK